MLEVAKRKSEFDKNNSWYLGSSTYLAEIKKEVDEVVEEIPKNRLCYLEDELGDVLWDYLNAILSLEKEAGVKIESVVKEHVGNMKNVYLQSRMVFLGMRSNSSRKKS
ncbi:MazG nucleotide pyrophosphohydrolase domain [Vibrio cholerae]|nr:MazG nucleotide pyrophosphohydrolase domain [Vibrio cholerae]GHX15898.1 mazG-related protein [Vibrio cholerae]